MLNIRFIIKMLGWMFIIETFFMLLATGVAFLYKGSEAWILLECSLIILATGGIFYAIGFRANEHNAGRREGMLTVAFTWGLFSLLGMLPFYLGGYIDNITDAYFETMSGFTTTGATILTNIEALPKGILFWRSLTQWQGGIGMIVFTVALLPIIGGGATQLFNAETPGITHERFRPRITQVAKRLWGVYLFLTLFVMVLLWAGPMNLFDAVNHAFTCISTGGYSTKNASIAYWNSPYIEYVIAIFMFIGATNMSLIYFCINGHPKKLFHDEEFHWYFWCIVIVVVITTLWLMSQGIVNDVELAFRQSLFQVISLITTTGFATTDYIPWGAFFWMVTILLMFICGCAGSTCGGFKMGRFAILAKNLFNQFKMQTHPHAIIPVRMNGHVISTDIVHQVLAFAFAYIAVIVVAGMLLTIDGMGFEEAVGAAISGISNVGPGLGSLGPIGNYAHIPDFSKWVLCFVMMVGRLEIFTVLTILLPSFWKQ